MQHHLGPVTGRRSVVDGVLCSRPALYMIQLPTYTPQDYSEMLSGLIAAEEAAAGGTAEESPAPGQPLAEAVVAMIDDWFEKAEGVVAASGEDDGARHAVNQGMAKVLAYAGDRVPERAQGRANGLVGASVFGPLNTGFSEETLNDLLVSVAALQLAAAGAVTGSARRAADRNWGSDFVPALLQKRMCSLTSGADVRSLAACADRSQPWPCAKSRLFQNCLRMHQSVVLESGQVALPSIEMDFLDPSLPTFTGAVLLGAAEWSDLCNPDRVSNNLVSSSQIVLLLDLDDNCPAVDGSVHSLTRHALHRPLTTGATTCVAKRASSQVWGGGCEGEGRPGAPAPANRD